MSIQEFDRNSLLFTVIMMMNLYTYLLFLVDKKRAIGGKRNRISERKLLVSSFLVGGLGGLLGMYLHRHKTKHTNFKVLVPIAAILTSLIIGYLWTM